MKKHYLYYNIVGISFLLLLLNVVLYYKTKGISSSFMSLIILTICLEVISMRLKKHNIIKKV